MTQSSIEKGSALERAVRAIESAILTRVPELKNNTFTIECNKIFIVNGVKHEIDVYIEVDLGKEYKSVYIFECKNRKSKVNKNDIVVFSKKIDVLQAQKGFFVAKSYGKYALAQAKEDKRIVILLATEFDSASTIVPFDFNYCFEKNKNTRFDVVPKRAGNWNAGFPVDIKTAEAILDGNAINFEEYMDNWVDDLVNKDMKHFPKPNTPDGLYNREIPAKREFRRHKLKVNGKAIRYVALLISFEVQIVRPAVLSHFEVEGRGRTLELAQVSHDGADIKVRLSSVPK